MIAQERALREAHGDRGLRQWREAGMRSASYYRRDRPGREGGPVICEHPAEAAEPDEGAPCYSARRSTCQ